MGCGQSTAAAAAVVEPSSGKIPPAEAPASSSIKGRQELASSAATAASHAHVNSLAASAQGDDKALQKNTTDSTAPSTTTTPNATPTRKSGLHRRNDFAVRPGYSSGASSYDGSLSDGEELDRMEELLMREEEGLDALQTSRHSDILALGTLRQEMVADGDLAKTVVRIEPSYGQPIEDVYDGVSDGVVLGSGVSGIVRLVTHRKTQVKYAVKILELGLIDSTEGLRQLRNEIFIMCQLDHPNIVRIEEVYESTNEIYIVQELCLGGDLFDRLDEQPDYHYTEPQCARLVKQMLSAVRYLHSKGIIHRDLKLENFLFSTRDADSELRMIDFGLSKHFIDGQFHHEKVGTPYTVAPEIIQGHYDEKSDIWALGVITYLLLSGETPFGGLDGEHPLLVKQNIQRAELLFEPADLWESVSTDAVAFVKRLLQPDPAKRPTAKETQKDSWIQVWAKKDAATGNRINPKTIGALMAFKEQSDMQKLLSEVLSFTLLPEQIVELRAEFQKMDTDGSGEISLNAMKLVLMQNAEAGALGGLTEREVESLFETMRVRKTDTTIRWHEFLAAGLSQAKIDDRNLRLAFDRMDNQRKGFVTLQDLKDMLGNSADAENLERVWLDSLSAVQSDSDRISYDDFKRLMKGQDLSQPPSRMGTSKSSLKAVPEDLSSSMRLPSTKPMAEIEERRNRRFRSKSFQGGAAANMWAEPSDDGSLSSLQRGASTRLFHLLQEESRDELEDMSPLMANRTLYRRHREMRLQVLEASKQFDALRKSRQADTQAGLVMKRGAKPPVEIEDPHDRAMFDAAAKRCGRAKRTRNKTVSDVTGMMISHKDEQ